MGQYAQMIVSAAKISRSYAERLLVGITPQQFARSPVNNGKLIQTNHPAWVYGHLAIYPVKIATMVGLDSPRFAAPAAFEPLFKDATESKDDAAGTNYPSMETITTAFFTRHDALFEALAGVSDAALLAETADEKARIRFPQVGSRVLFMCNNHIAMHLGQVSAWRRCMGLPPA
jgi:hypothetical protein